MTGNKFDSKSIDSGSSADAFDALDRSKRQAGDTTATVEGLKAEELLAEEHSAMVDVLVTSQLQNCIELEQTVLGGREVEVLCEPLLPCCRGQQASASKTASSTRMIALVSRK